MGFAKRKDMLRIIVLNLDTKISNAQPSIVSSVSVDLVDSISAPLSVEYPNL